MSPGIYVIMLNWDSYEHNAACLASLQQSSSPARRIVVVDNGSKDGSIERLMADHRSNPQVLFIRNAQNEGFAGGMNIGIRAALLEGAGYVFLINNDTIVGAECLGELARALERHPEAGLAGPAIYYHRRPDIIWQSAGKFSPLRGGVVVRDKGRHRSVLGTEEVFSDFLTGCAVMVRRQVFESIGFLDRSYFFYGEDLDFDLRARSAGFSLLFVPQAAVWHKIEDVATDRTSPYVLYHLARSSVILYRRRFRLPYRLYGIILQFVVYTPFRAWQVLKGRTGLVALGAWLRGLVEGLKEPLTENPASDPPTGVPETKQ